MTPGTDSSGCRDLVVSYRKDADLCRMTSVLLVWGVFVFLFCFVLFLAFPSSLGREDPLEKEMATHSSTLAWKIPWMEEPGRLQSMGSQRIGHD